MLFAGLFSCLMAGGCAGVYSLCDDNQCRNSLGCAGQTPVVCDVANTCREMVCDGKAWTCGPVGDGSHAWTDAKMKCNDGDPCTTDDRCSAGACTGAKVVCSTPPAASCVNSDLLQTFLPQGKCAGGNCTYTGIQTSCKGKGGCKQAKCAGDPCAGVSCTKPPTACHKTPGTCSGGTCSYTKKPGADCGGTCVDTSTSATHCGGCNKACKDSVYKVRACKGGVCTDTASVCTRWSAWKLGPVDSCGKDTVGKTYCRYECAYSSTLKLKIFCASAYASCVCSKNDKAFHAAWPIYKDGGTCPATCKLVVGMGLCTAP